MRKIIAVLALFLILTASAHSQTVRQSGSVTPGHPAAWTTTGVIQDGGTPAQGRLTGIGVTANGPGICQNSGPVTGAYNQLCFGTTATGGEISLYNFGGATGGFTFNLNGATQGFPVVSPLPTISGDLACFLNTAGSLTDCGTAALATLSLGNNEIPVGQTAADPVSMTATGWFDAAYCNTVGYVIARLTGAWTCAQGIPVNITWFGADNTGTDPSYAAIDNAITAAGSNPVFCPQGVYRVASTFAKTSPINFYGPSNGYGPGATVDASTSFCRLLIESSGVDVFHVTSEFPSNFHDFQIRKTNGTAGIGINLDNSNAPANNVVSRINNVAFVGIETAIRILKPGYNTVSENIIKEWGANGGAGIILETDIGVEGAGGWIEKNVFDAGGSATAGPAIYSEVGYAWVKNNEIVGGNWGIWFNYNNGNAGFTQIINNTIENQRTGGIRLSSADGSFAAFPYISGNEIGGTEATLTHGILVEANVTNPVWLTELAIVNNPCICPDLGAGDTFVEVQVGANVSINGNTIRQTTGAINPTGVKIGGGATDAGLIAPVNVFDNIIAGTTNKYSFVTGPATILRDLNGMTVAQIPANIGHGSQVYVTDAKYGVYPVVTGGTGALVTNPGGSLTAQGTATSRTLLPLMAAAGLTGGSTSYFVTISSTLAGAAEANVAALGAVTGTLKNFYISVSTAPTAGQNIVFTLRVNGSDTAVTCTIADTATTCNDTTHTASITAGQAWSVKAVYSATAATSYPIGGIEYAIP